MLFRCCAYWIALLLFFWDGLTAATAAEPVPASRIGHSVYRDVWHAILDEAGIEARLIAAPRDVRRDMFIKGDLLLDCCSNPVWRERPEEKRLQHFTQPFAVIVDHLILHKERDYHLPDPTDLSAYKVALIRGFTYPSKLRFGETIRRVSMRDTFQAVADGEADMTVASTTEFQRRQQDWPRALKLGPVCDRVLLSGRVHEKARHLLPRINDAIERLKERGRIDRLTGQAVREW
ncbi:substrate-binding periplasmic protein [Yunchengibacter salinarum]|uniref:substrate-binding periplasmic protein n=1 Tax=Yunchengibacter salinarum TaxID=3133399 RepID=UPI0035B6A508